MSQAADHYGTKTDTGAPRSGIGRSPRTCGISGPDIPSPLLSAQLRAQTAPQHQQTEALLGFPDTIQTLADYRLCLCKFLGLYRPLERSLANFSEWDQHGFLLPSPNQNDCLAADLAVLGVEPASVLGAAPQLLPALPTFAHALGALYVLEGSRLGGRIILRALEERIGPQISGATRFFGDRGTAVGQTWLTFKTALDAFGDTRPILRGDVVSGAKSVFLSMTAWFAPMDRITGSQS